jgi:hypothetical protein
VNIETLEYGSMGEHVGAVEGKRERRESIDGHFIQFSPLPLQLLTDGYGEMENHG